MVGLASVGGMVFRMISSKGPVPKDVQAVYESERRQKHVLNGIRHYQAHHAGEYPVALSLLVGEGILDEKDLKFTRVDGVTVTIRYLCPMIDHAADAVILYDNGVVLPLGLDIEIVVTRIDGGQGLYRAHTLEEAIKAIQDSRGDI
jgi:hypothetical protein